MLFIFFFFFFFLIFYFIFFFFFSSRRRHTRSYRDCSSDVCSSDLTLQLFANGTLDPTATNFRRAAYALGVSAILVPPVTAVLLARWLRAEPASGATWKALLLAAAGQFAALAAGIVAAPHFWIVLPVQVIAIGLGTSLGLHWGPRARRAPDAAMGRARAEPLPAEATVHIPGLCADPALAGGAHVG